MAEYTELIKALRLCQFGECGCGKCYYKELKGDWCTEDNHPEFFDCDDKLKLDAAAAIEELENALADECKECDYLVNENTRLTTENKEMQAQAGMLDKHGTDLHNEGYDVGYYAGRRDWEPKRGEWILTNDEIETIRIHMNAIKEQLCNQYRHREAEAYQTIVDKLAKMTEVQDGD